MLPWSALLAGRIDEHVFASDVLRGNPLSDPWERPLWVYTPPGYQDEQDRRYPAVYVIQGYTGMVPMWRNRMPFRQPFPETADAVFARGEAPPVIVVYIDAWTALGGSQYVDSPGTGRYHTYICEEIVPWVDAHYRTIADRDHRAISGKSSGGYGAMITPMLRPDLFGAFATHAGDSLFEACYQREMPAAARLLRDHYDGSVERFLEDFRSRIPMTKEGDGTLIEWYGCSAAYSADEDGTVRLPFDDVGRPIPAVWQRWLAWDPVVMARKPEYAEALRSMRGMWIDAGTRDDYYLDLGATAFRAEVAKAGVPDDRVFFELFDATHAAIEYRYPMSLSWLAHRLTS
jgi:Putative esterase